MLVESVEKAKRKEIAKKTCLPSAEPHQSPQTAKNPTQPAADHGFSFSMVEHHSYKSQLWRPYLIHA